MDTYNELVELTHEIQAMQEDDGSISCKNDNIIGKLNQIKNLILKETAKLELDNYGIAICKDIDHYIKNDLKCIDFSNSVLALKLVNNMDKFFFWGPLRTANGIRKGWGFESFISLRDDPISKEFDEIYSSYPHPKNICQASHLLAGTKGIVTGNNIVFFPENIKSTIDLKKQTSAIFFFNKFYDIYNEITIPLWDSIGDSSQLTYSRNIDRVTNYKARCVWGYFHDYFHHQGSLPFDENISLKTNWYVGVIEEIKVDLQTLIELMNNSNLAYRNITIEYILFDRIFRYTKEQRPLSTFDSATAFFLISYFNQMKVLLVDENNNLYFNFDLIKEAALNLIDIIKNIEDNLVDIQQFKADIEELFFAYLHKSSNLTDKYSLPPLFTKPGFNTLYEQ